MGWSTAGLERRASTTQQAHASQERRRSSSASSGVQFGEDAAASSVQVPGRTDVSAVRAFEEASLCRSESSDGVTILEEGSPESIVSSQDVESVPWWAHLLKQHARHLAFNDSQATRLTLVSTCSGMLAEAFALKASGRERERERERDRDRDRERGREGGRERETEQERERR